MAQRHLDELEQLNQAGWTVLDRIVEIDQTPGIIGRWLILRGSEQVLDFEGNLDRINSSPALTDAFACNLRGMNASLYFYKRGKNWDRNLSQFVQGLNELT